MTFGFLVAGTHPATGDERMSPQVAAQLGLEEVWVRHLFVPAGAQSIADIQLIVHASDPREYLELIEGTAGEPTVPGSKPNASQPESSATTAAPPAKVLSRIAVGSAATGAQGVNKAEAERLAGNEIRRLKRRGIEATQRTIQVPRVHIYTLANDGTIDCRDAETGQPLWRSSVGDPRLGYGKMGIDDEFLAFVNGGNLVKVDVTTGEQIESLRTNNVPAFGAVISGRYALIPTIRNGIEGYPLDDPADDPFTQRVEGMALAPPASAPGSTRVAWGTNRGFVYAMELDGEPTILFRLNIDGLVGSQLAAINGDRFFFGSDNGQVYALHATRMGNVLWSRPYSEPFYNSPIVFGKQIFLRSTFGSLYALSMDDGFMTWPDVVPNVDELIGIFGGRIYVRLFSGILSVIDTETGKTVRQVDELRPNHFLANSQTNRLYLISRNGTIQCLRPQGADLPSFNELIRPIPGKKKPVDGADDPGGKPGPASPSDPDSADPFGAPASDPFAAPGSDPFDAPGGDPFGAPAGNAMDDPFGSSDPFAP